MTEPVVYRRSNLRDVLLDRALTVLGERGEGSLSLRQLAREVGVSHAAPARHFADRDTLIEALALEGFRQLEELLRTAASPGVVRSVTERIAMAYLEFALAKANLVEVMFRHDPDRDRTVIGSSAAQAFHPIVQVFERARDEGCLRDGGDPRAAATLFLATLQGVVALVSCGVIKPGVASQLVADAVPRYIADRDQAVSKAVV